MTITVADFRARFVEFRDANVYPDSLIQMYIDDSVAEVDFSLFGPRANKAQCYWVAHWLTLGSLSATTDAATGDPAGPARRIASESEGDTSVSYVAPASNDPFDELWGSTLYGQVWLAMYKFAVPGVTSTGTVVFANPRMRRPGPFGGY